MKKIIKEIRDMIDTMRSADRISLRILRKTKDWYRIGHTSLLGSGLEITCENDYDADADQLEDNVVQSEDYTEHHTFRITRTGISLIIDVSN